MTRWQRRTLGTVGSLILVTALLLAIAVSSDPSADGSTSRDGEAAGDGQGGTTTIPLVAVTAASTTTTAPTTTAPTTTAAPATTTTLPPVITGAGAVLVRPSTAVPRPLVSGCADLADEGWRTSSCDRVATAGAELIWLVETQPGRLRALVLRQATAGAWITILASDADGSRWTDIRVKALDVSGDGAAEIGFGFHQSGPAAILAVDLVEGPGRVVAHDDLAKGSAKVAPRRFDTWAVSGADAGTFVHQTIGQSAGSWRRLATDQVSAPSVPRSDL